MADAKITVSAQDLSAAVLDKTIDSMGRMRSAAEEATQKSGVSFQRLFTTIAGGVASGELLEHAIERVGEAATSALEALPELVEHSIGLGNEIYEMSLKTGASVENLSALRYVASQAGIDFESFGTTLFKMQQALGASGPQATTLQRDLAVLGLDLQTLKNEKPDQAFIDIMDALEKLPNRADQAAIGVAVFGRGFKEMAGLTQESIKELIAEADHLGLTMTTDQAAAAHAAEIGWKSLQLQFEAVRNSIGRSLMPTLVALEQLAIESFNSVRSEVGDVGTLLDRQHVDGAIDRIGEALITGTAAAAGFAEGATAGLQNVLDWSIRTGQAVVNLADILLEVATLGTVDEKGKTILDRTQHALHDTFDALEALKVGVDTGADVAEKAFGAVEHVADGMAGKFHDAYASAQHSIEDFAHRSHEAFGGIGEDVDAVVDKVLDGAKRISALRDLTTTSQATIGTFLGGGNILGGGATSLPTATMALGPDVPFTRGIDQQALESLFGLPTDKLPGSSSIGLQPDRLSDTLNAAREKTDDWHTSLQNTSLALSQLATVGGNSFRGVVQDLSTAVESTNALDAGFKALSSSGGGFEGLVGKASGALTLVSGAASLLEGIGKALNIGGPSDAEKQARKDRTSAFQQAGLTLDNKGIQTAEDSLTQFGASAEQAQRLVGAALDAKTPEAFARAMAPVNEALQRTHTLEGEVSNVSGLIAAYENAGHVIPASMVRTLQMLQQMPGLTDAERTSIQGLVDSAKPNFDTLESVAEKYGGTLQGLGPKLAQGQLNETAQGIEQDFKDLTEAGGEAGNVVGLMHDKIQDLVNQAITSGSSLPQFMQPLIENLKGDLKDAQGNLIDISKIQFNDTPTADGLDGMSTKLGDIQKQLSDDVPSALHDLLAQIPNNPFANWNVPAPSGGATSFADEGFDIARPTRAIVGDAPSDTENVVHSSSIRQLFSDARRIGASVTSDAVVEHLAALRGAMREQGAQLERLMRLQPLQLAHAMRGRR